MIRTADTNKRVALVVALFALVGGILIYTSNANPNLPGDVNNDNVVNITDLSILLSNWGKTYSGNPNPNPNPNPNIPSGSDGTADASECTQTAAAKLGWGEPQYQSHFNTATLDPRWHAYGPEPGHQKKGTRTPAAIKTQDGNVVITGSEGGTTGAMKFFPSQKYGRWEGCMKVGPGNGFNALFLHWSDDETFSSGGGEIDWAEIFAGDRNNPKYFLHCGNGGPNCDTGSVNHDSTQWTAWAVEWTPTAIIAYVNGREWKRSTNTGQFPPRSMNWCIQLDWMGNAGVSSMLVDWTKQYTTQHSQPGTLGLKPGEPATGQPGDYPQRKPRPLTVRQMLGIDP